MRRHLLTAAVTALLIISPTAALAVPGNSGDNGAGGVTGLDFYVDGERYRTVVTPTDLSGTGAPDASFDTIYAIDGQPNVATAAPGDQDYNGGRWKVHALGFADYDGAVDAVDANGSGDIDSAAEVDDALMNDLATDQGVIASFECPVIPAHGPHL